jgi:hypothetical protein
VVEKQPRLKNYSETEWLIRHLKPRKAAGPDDTQNTVLQHLPQLDFKFIAQTYDKSTALHYLPSKWREAKVVLLSKQIQDYASPLNYRSKVY